MNEKEKSVVSPYYEYKDKVKYDYIMKAKQPIILKSSNYKNINKVPEKQIEDALSNMEDASKESDCYLYDEDYLAECFPELGVGRVYTDIDEITEDSFDILFGFSLKDSNSSNITEDDLKDGIKALCKDLASNYEFENEVSGWEISGEEDGHQVIDKAEVDYISFECKKEDPTIEVIEKPKKVEEQYDKKLVEKGRLNFIKENKSYVYNFNQYGIVECFNNKKFEKLISFNKDLIQQECINKISEGYVLKEDTNIEKSDLDNKETELKNQIKQVDHLQDLKDELLDKVDNLVTESKNKKEFPSTDFTSHELTLKELTDTELKDNLSEEQQEWIKNNIGQVEELQNALLNLKEFLGDSELISIDNYIKEIMKEDE